MQSKLAINAFLVNIAYHCGISVNDTILVIFCRLQYFARGVQVYIKQLRATLQGKQGDELKTDEVTWVCFLIPSNHCSTLVYHLKEQLT